MSVFLGICGNASWTRFKLSLDDHYRSFPRNFLMNIIGPLVNGITMAILTKFWDQNRKLGVKIHNFVGQGKPLW